MTDKLAGTPTTASEVWFDTYLRAHGYTWEPEPDLVIRVVDLPLIAAGCARWAP
jgi:hypothetical protein